MRLVLTPGMGIGPEVTVRALARGLPEGARVALVGRAEPLARAAREQGRTLERAEELCFDAVDAPVLRVFEPPDTPEPVEVAAIRLGAQACLEGRADALVTGPIHKARLAARGFAHLGHTDLLGEICGAKPVMAFAGGELRVALVTVHVPLLAVPGLITAERVARTARIAEEALRRDLSLQRPRIAICGLNPHAGEGGLLGREEIEVIGPAAEALRRDGLDVRGPVSAETAFLEARAGRVDLVVAMYHDQGLAPLKAVDAGRSVNWTLGLPIVRTSVDHGTADALVGTGLAESSSMEAAIRLACQIVRTRLSASGG